MSSKDEQEQLEKEIMIGTFDQLLDEADGLCTARSKISQNRAPSRSNTFKKISEPMVNNEQLITSQTLGTSDIDDLLSEIDLHPISIEPNTPKPKMSTEPVIFVCQHIFQENLAGAGFFAQPKFCKMLKEEIQKSYSVETNITKSKDKSHLEDPIYIIEFKSKDKNKINKAEESLKSLFAAVATKMLDDHAGFWVRYSDCVRIVQAYSDQNASLHTLCEYQTIGLTISYFNKDKSIVFPNICTNDATLNKIIQEKFRSLDIPLPSTSDLTKDNKSNLAQDILKLESEMRSQNILIILEQRRIRLFGFVDLVEKVQKQIEEIKKEYISNTVKLDLESKQIKYLLDIYGDELKALEANYNDAKIVEPLQNGEFTAPRYLHNTIEQQIMTMAILCTPSHFEIQEEAFCVTAQDRCPNLINIGRQYKCQIQIQENIKNHICEIPKASTQDHISHKLTAAAIKIHKDDLAAQKVDLVVISSISMYLRDDILKKAGPSVQQEYIEAAKLSSSEPFETNSGQLQCRKLLFLPWEINRTSQEAFYQSIRNFVSKAVQHAIKAHHTSIAFPSIGCGQLKVDKNVVANEMLVEAQKQLLTANVILQIIFVILPEQSDVYETFQTKLKNLQKGNVERKDAQNIYKLTTLSITIISSNAEKQEACKKALNDYVQNSVSVREFLQQDVLRRWTQPAINAFYEFCLSQHVVLDMNITNASLKLFGSKESVSQADVKYHQEQAKQSEQARLAALARHIIWAYKIDDTTLEKYSPELNAHIEDAYSSKVLSFNYTDDKSKEYTIDFKTMIETCISNQTQREIIRHPDFNSPEHWEVQSENVAQFKLQVDSTEYQEVRALFDKTMANKYAEILQIDRIQNKPWYMQYNSYKSFSPKKDTEKKLFHGCPHASAQLIIHSFFNRSFAGANATVYGQGAYFSANANYSHNYATPSTANGKRYMFVANVLVGDTILGHTSMKTPPPGFDSTTDGDHIFVTYRDDQAYAAYLIVYK